MTLPSSGPIGMSQINVELAIPATTTISLNQTNVRALAGVPSGIISLSNFYGKSNLKFFFAGGVSGLLQPPAGPRVTYTDVFSFDPSTNTYASVLGPGTSGETPAGVTPNAANNSRTACTDVVNNRGVYNAINPATATQVLYNFNLNTNTMSTGVAAGSSRCVQNSTTAFVLGGAAIGSTNLSTLVVTPSPIAPPASPARGVAAGLITPSLAWFFGGVGQPVANMPRYYRLDLPTNTNTQFLGSPGLVGSQTQFPSPLLGVGWYGGSNNNPTPGQVNVKFLFPSSTFAAGIAVPYGARYRGSPFSTPTSGFIFNGGIQVAGYPTGPAFAAIFSKSTETWSALPTPPDGRIEGGKFQTGFTLG